MKTQQDNSPQDLGQQAMDTEKKTQNENHREMTPIPLDDGLISDYKEAERELKDISTRRVLELSRKGIYACPRHTRFFNDDADDVRIC